VDEPPLFMAALHAPDDHFATQREDSCGLKKRL